MNKLPKRYGPWFSATDRAPSGPFSACDLVRVINGAQTVSGALRRCEDGSIYLLTDSPALNGARPPDGKLYGFRFSWITCLGPEAAWDAVFDYGIGGLHDVRLSIPLPPLCPKEAL